jgi:hypothetical protein
MRLKEINRRVNLALQILLEKDIFLFDKDIREESLSHKLGFHLQYLFDGWNVDCEYTRAPEGRRKSKVDWGEFRPDIIIHKRGDNTKLNLVAIEVKKGAIEERKDITNLNTLTNKTGEFRYKYGFFIGFKDSDGEKIPIKRLYTRDKSNRSKIRDYP